MQEVILIISERNNDDRAVSVSRQARARSAQKPFCQTTLTTVSNDDELVVTRQFDEYGARVAGNDQGSGVNTLLGCDCLSTGQNFLSIGMCYSIITQCGICCIEGDSSITRQRICADNLQFQTSMFRVICSPPHSLIARIGSINADKHGLLLGTHCALLPWAIATVPLHERLL